MLWSLDHLLRNRTENYFQSCLYLFLITAFMIVTFHSEDVKVQVEMVFF